MPSQQGSRQSLAAGLIQHVLAQKPQPPEGGGSGRSLPPALLIVSTLSAIFATLFSIYLIWKQLKNYRKPTLQRYVVRLLVMVPIYSIASVISLYSLDLADLIDLIRDLYEAFVIYCFFNLLIEYLGGERSLIILLHGRRPQEHIFPMNIFLTPMDASDPYTFLALKRGVLQYVQIKPILAILTVLLKSLGKYQDGKISPTNGYTWVSFTYNVSVFLSLYCLGMFWKCLNDDLKPFRVTSKFLCVKGIIFFSFWQGLGISILVAAGLIKKIGPVADPEYISLAVQDFMICLEMPIFALGHAYAFSHTDYIDPFAHYAARLPVYYALRDCIGMYDVFSDSLTTVRGTGYGYQTFEPSEGVLHQSLARERRSKAGLRYTQGGKGKYWLPQRGTGDFRDATKGARHQGPMSAVRKYINNKRMFHQGFAPLAPEEAAEIIHDNPDAPPEEDEGSALLKHPHHLAKSALHRAEEGLHFFVERAPDSDDEIESLTFGTPPSDEDDLYNKSRGLNHGDYAYPNVDVAREQTRKNRWKNDDAIVHRRRKKSITSADGRAAQRAGSKNKGKDKDSSQEGAGSGGGGQDSPRKVTSSWLAWDKDADGDAKSAGESSKHSEPSGIKRKEAASPKPQNDPYGAVDLVVEDFKAEERERLLERRRGDPALRAGKNARIFKKQYEDTNGQRGLKLNDEEMPPSKKRFADAEQVVGDKRTEDQSPEPKHQKRMEEAALDRVAQVKEEHGPEHEGNTKEGNEATMENASIDPGIDDSQPIARMVVPDSIADFKRGVLPGRMHSVKRDGGWKREEEPDHNPWD